MRVDLTPYSLLAFLLVVVAAVAAAGLAEATRRWAAGLIRRAPRVAAAGLVLTAAAAVNVLVPRTCASGASRNRPLLAAVADGPCRAESILQVAAVVVLAVAATVAVGVASRGRPHPHAADLASR